MIHDVYIQSFYSHCTGQPVLACTPHLELKDFVEAKFCY